MPNMAWPNSGRIFANEYSTVNLNCAFTVTPTDASGITNLKQGIKAFAKNLQVRSSYVAPVTGGSINVSGSSVLTIGAPYQIVTVGTTTQAQWQAVGLPLGLVPAAGQVFLSKVTGSGTGTGTVKAVGTSGIQKIEFCGDPNLTIAPFDPLSNVNGSWLVLQCLAPTDSATTTVIPTAPATGTIIKLELYQSQYGSSK